MNRFEVIQGKTRQFLTKEDTQLFVERLLAGTDRQNDVEQLLNSLPMFQSMHLIDSKTEATVKVFNAGPLQ